MHMHKSCTDHLEVSGAPALFSLDLLHIKKMQIDILWLKHMYKHRTKKLIKIILIDYILTVIQLNKHISFLISKFCREPSNCVSDRVGSSFRKPWTCWVTVLYSMQHIQLSADGGVYSREACTSCCLLLPPPLSYDLLSQIETSRDLPSLLSEKTKFVSVRKTPT